MARPKLQIDPNQVEQLAAIFCTVEEMAAVLGCSKDTLERRFAAPIERGRAKGRSSIRRAQYKVAITKENTSMLIWLGKQYLAQKEKLDEDHPDEIEKVGENVKDDKDKIIATARGKK